MKRLLCIVSCMNAGGAETFIMKIYRQLDKTKYQIDFVVNVKEECFYDKEINELGGRIYYVPPKSDNYSEFKKQLTEIVQHGEYELVMRMCSNAMSFLDLKIAKKANGAKCIARATNSKAQNTKNEIAHKIGRLLYDGYVDVKIAPSDLAAKYTFGEKAYNNGEVIILHNAVNYDTYKFSPKERNIIRNEFNISERSLAVGHVGRFSKQKNHSFLIDVFFEICKKNPDSVLILVGTGELESEIIKKCEQMDIREKVVFTDVRSDVPALLSAMDVLVFPSLYEGMPNVVIEAQAAGLPCVISDSITQEANITGNVSYLPLGDPAAWAKMALSAICEERANPHQLFVEQQYDIKSVAEKFTEVIFDDE